MNKYCWMGLTLILAGLSAACVHRPRPLPESPARLALPTADLNLLIPGLGPCSDTPGQTLSLDSRQPVLVLVHGVRGRAGDFQGLAQALAGRGHQAVAFSYRDRDSLMVSSGRLARCLESLAAAMDGQRIIVIGHSLGGLIARKALVSDREDPLRSAARLTLVTIATPFGGIRAAGASERPLAQILSLGLSELISRAINGDKWREITASSEFIRAPGQLAPQVDRHLLIRTDERGARGDRIFTLAEQRAAAVERDPRTEILEIKAGHVAIIGADRSVPSRLLAALQAEGILG